MTFVYCRECEDTIEHQPIPEDEEHCDCYGYELRDTGERLYRDYRWYRVVVVPNCVCQCHTD